MMSRFLKWYFRLKCLKVIWQSVVAGAPESDNISTLDKQMIILVYGWVLGIILKTTIPGPVCADPCKDCVIAIMNHQHVLIAFPSIQALNDPVEIVMWRSAAIRDRVFHYGMRTIMWSEPI